MNISATSSNDTELYRLENPPVKSEPKKITLKGFNLTDFDLPDDIKYGVCTLINGYKKVARIEEGRYATIYKATENISKEFVALKKIDIKNTTTLPQHYFREISVLQTLKHDNVVRMSTMAVQKSFNSYSLILEYCPFCLRRVLTHEKAKLLLREAEVKNIMRQLFTGLSYLHKNFIIHRKLSTKCIVFSDKGVLKISGFSMCRPLSEGEMTPDIDNLQYNSPEILFGSKAYDRATDMWSAGCIIGEVILKKKLLDGSNNSEVISCVVDLLGTPTEKIWPGFSELPGAQLYNVFEQPYSRLRVIFHGQSEPCLLLLEKILLYYSKQRINAQDSIRHPYFYQFPFPSSNETLLTILKASDE